MNKMLFLLCPTDCLEPIVNDAFEEEHFFYTSIGNSFSYDFETLIYLKDLIIENRIKEIQFIISEDNKIMLDALGKQSFSNIRGLKVFYKEVMRQKENSDALWQDHSHQFSVLSYYLNHMIKKLQSQLSCFGINQISIEGKVYDRQEAVFNKIYPDLLCLEKHYLN